MRQKLGFIAMWFGATVLAVSIAWFGVRDVLHRGAFDDVKIEPLSAANNRMGAAPPVDPVVLLGTPTAWATPEEDAGSGRTAAPSPSASQPRPARSQAENTDGATRPRASATPLPSRSSALAKPAQTSAAPKPASTTAAPKPASTTAAPKPASTTAAPKPASTTAAPKSTSQAAPSGDVRVVRVNSGTVSFTIENGVCRLVSAVPKSGFQVKTAQNDGWIRVDLFQGDHGSAAFCIGHENRTDTWEY
jgi:hypothetical protein